MSVNSLIPRNTQNARAVGVGAFKRFLESEVVDLDYIHACLSVDPSGKKFTAVMDQFGAYLAFNENAKGQKLKRNTVMSYFRQVKLWLMEVFPQSRSTIESRVLKMGRILDKHCLTREGGGLVKKDNACTKHSLHLLIKHLYTAASGATDYQDAALLCLMWYLFGRASDLSLAQKQNMSVCSRGVFFLRIVRVKTSEEQGLTLFPDRDIYTCPLLAIAAALAMQAAPSVALLDHLPVQKATVHVDLSATASLRERLESECSENVVELPQSVPSSGTGAPGVHNYVNRLLERGAVDAGIKTHLSSHSFRRGGAQHANGDAGLSAQWIFDRGGWNLAPTNKAFEYVLNTTAEDQRVAKVLSEWDAQDGVVPQDLSVFDSKTKTRLDRLTQRLFSTCTWLSDTSLVVCPRVLELLLVRLLQAYPQLKDASARAPLVQKLEVCALNEGIVIEELVSWSLAVSSVKNTKPATSEKKAEAQTLVEQQAIVIKQLLGMNRELAERMQALEAKLDPYKKQTEQQDKAKEDVSSGNRPRTKAAVTHLSTAWFDWYAGEPRLWATSNRKKKFEVKSAVAYMKLFLSDGFVLDQASSTYRDDVVALGVEAEKATLSFLESNGIRSRGIGGALKHLRILHRRGLLNDAIRTHKALLSLGAIIDPAPMETQNIMAVQG